MLTEERALVVAMELLRERLEQLPTALAANTKRSEADLAAQARAALDLLEGRGGTPGAPAPAAEFGRGGVNAAPGAGGRPAPPRPGDVAAGGAADGGGRKGGAGGAQALMSVLGAVGAKFAAVAGPMAVLGAVLSSATSGFQVLGKVVQLLGTTLGPILLPVVTVLSAGLLAFSDLLLQVGMPIFESWFSFVLSHGIPAMEFLIDTVEEATTGLNDFLEALADIVRWVEEQIDALNPFSSSDESPDERTVFGMRWSGRGRGEASVASGLTDTLRSLRMSMGPKAQISGIADVGRQVQQAALSADPIEARMLRVQQDMLNRLERIAANTAARRGRVYDPAAAAAVREAADGAIGIGEAILAGEGGDYGG